LFAVDVVEWARSLGQRALQRALPCRTEVLLLQHLRSAIHRLRLVHLTDPERALLGRVLNGAARDTEEQMPAQLRPLIEPALTESGIRPRNYPERLALHKRVEELLDRVSARGVFTLGDLRHALSRSNLKMSDLSGPVECVWGDALLQANRRLA